ncbi:coiled-coil domain-containing protein 80 [Lampris incognitus]|uniref:coiled-coil domain-containing protein 80 n=1 Tax=Lampris incognitus TaxID=2546036 RepID=UPI0024B5061E|nr:coiled-coil domain-containing protein 80 [Lampris incognitus]
MLITHKSQWSLLALVVLWNISNLSLLAAWEPRGALDQSKDHVDPNVRDWGDYSDLQSLAHGLGLEEDRRQERNGRVEDPSSGLVPELEFLAEFGGKKRLWVITAPSHNDHYLVMMEKQLEDMEQEGLNCRLAERDTFIVIIIQNAMMEGQIHKTTLQGEATVESLDPDTVTKLLHYLDLTNQDQEFSMLVLRKNLRVSERFPYPVRVEAVLELIDQFPMRKLEKMTRKGTSFRCKFTKKKVVVKKKKIKKIVLSSQRQGNVTSKVAVQRKPVLNKKAALKTKIQDILSGRARFVIRKTPNAGSTGGKNSSISTSTSNTQDKQETHRHVAEALKSKEEVKINRHDSAVEGGKKTYQVKHSEDKTKEERKRADSKGKTNPKKKGRGKKGKGRGKKSNSETSDEEKTPMKEFVDSLKGKRRLMVISTPSSDATLYVQQKEENEKHYCDLAVRRVTLATLLGEGHNTVLTLQHYQLDSEPPFSDHAEQFSDPDLISLLRSELGLSSSDLFSMTVTDYDVKPGRVLEAPPTTPALLEYIDNFPSRRPEKEKENRSPPTCAKDQKQTGTKNSLLRFMSKRRLLLISTPSVDDYSYQQQLSALHGQECPMGIRHFALLKLIGAGSTATGTVELFPLNGRSQSEVEPLSRVVVSNLRDQLKISKDYFSMLVVGKDGDVKAWFPSPMWSLDNIYDLVDSMELRLQEEKLQRSLGIHCPEDRGGGGGQGEGYHGYDEDWDGASYQYHRTEN